MNAEWVRQLRRLAPGNPLETTLAVVLDLLVVGAAYTVAYLLRFDASVPGENVALAYWVVPVIAVAYVVANAFFGVYRTVWAYGSVGDVLALFRPVLLITALVFGGNLLVQDRDLPLSVVLIAGLLILPGMATVKMRTRLLSRMPWASVASRRLLIIGAGHTGQTLVREFQNSPGLNYQPIGYVDDDPKKHNRRMHGLRVFGPLSTMEKVISDQSVDAVELELVAQALHERHL